MNLFKFLYSYLELKRIKNQIKNHDDVVANVAGHRHMAMCTCYVATHVCICACTRVRVCVHVPMHMCN